MYIHIVMHIYIYMYVYIYIYIYTSYSELVRLTSLEQSESHQHKLATSRHGSILVLVSSSSCI